MMLREIITPQSPVVTMRLPDEMVGKTVEVIAFEIRPEDAVPASMSRQQRLEKLEAVTTASLIDLSNFKFDRDLANDYD